MDDTGFDLKVNHKPISASPAPHVVTCAVLSVQHCSRFGSVRSTSTKTVAHGTDQDKEEACVNLWFVGHGTG